MDRLQGKVAIITGSSRGLGAAIAQLYAEEGCSVLVSDIRDDDGERTAAAIRATGGSAAYQHLDVTSEAGWSEAVSRCRAEFGPPNVLVLNARAWKRGTLLETPIVEWQRLLEVNLGGAMLGMRAVIPEMRANGEGSIVSIGSSMGGEVAAGDGAAYQTSKAGLTALTKSVAAAYGADGIRANASTPARCGPRRSRRAASSTSRNGSLQGSR
jgi:3alpha(or 20beta)-hydroxysteroid dehydrogenase